MQFQGFTQILESRLLRLSLASNVHFQALSDEPLVFL